MNWDLQNYHLYNPFAFLTNRLSRDFMAADIQSYLNPLLDVPFYLAWTTWFHDRPRFATFLAGLPYGLAIFLCLRIAQRILPGPGRLRIVEVLAATVIGVTGSVTISEIGTTFNDIPIAVLILGALLVELRCMDNRSWPRLVSGFVVGLAAGLKLTAVVFAPGMALAIMLTRRRVGQALLDGAAFSLGWLVGLFVGGGWWAWRVYQQFGNPIFPMFNRVIGSPWFGDVVRDRHFMPHGALEAFFYPFFWDQGASTVSEVPMYDPRFAMTYVALVALIIGGCIFCISKRADRGEARSAIDWRRSAFLCIFFIVSFAVWEGMFSIVRYIVALELLSGVVIVLGVRSLCVASMRESTARLTSSLVVVVIAVVAIKDTRSMDWGRTQYENVSRLVDSRIVLPDGAVVLLVGRPVAFILPFISSANSTYVGVDGRTMILPSTSPAIELIHARLAGADGNTWVLTNKSVDEVDALVKSWDLVTKASDCRDLNQSPQQNVRICPLIKR